MAICQLVVNEDGRRAVLVFEAIPHCFNLILWNFKARPAIPLEGRCFGQTAETRHQASRGYGELILAALRASDRDWKAVGG